MASVVKQLVETLEKVLVITKSPLLNMSLVNRLIRLILEASGAASLPKVVCLCGSTRFKDAFIEASRTETLAGNIVLSVGMFGHSDPALMKDVPCPECNGSHVCVGSERGDCYFPCSHCNCTGKVKVFDQDSPTKLMLDELHRRKIDLADEVLVLNVGGYIGESTLSEIRHARTRGTPIRYLEPQYEEPV